MVLERWSSHCIAAAAGELKSELASVWGLVAMRCLVTHSSTWRFPARVVGGPGSGSWDHGAWSHGISLGNWSPRGRTAMPTRTDSDAGTVQRRPGMRAGGRRGFCSISSFGAAS